MLKIFNNKFVIAGILLALIIALSTSVYFYSQYQKTKTPFKTPSMVTKEDIKDLEAKVGKLIDLPQNEEPTIATVSDKDKLKNQPFFLNAQNGDKVLIYTQTKKAILFRPSLNKIIEVAPINIGQQAQSTPSATIFPAKTNFKAVIYNGSNATEAGKIFKNELLSKWPNIEIVFSGDAKKNDYANTLAIDLTEQETAKINVIAKTISAEVSILPDEELKPAGADFLFIIGNDYAKEGF